MTLKDGRRVAMTAEQARALWQDVEASCKATAEKLPDEKAALNAMVEAFHRLKDFGWREAMYCPKDGSGFQVIEAGGTGVHHCTYDGEWPDGSWWIHADGDLWPSRPILFRLYPAALLNQEASRNRNSGAPIMSDLAGVEGFTPEDFAEAAEAIDDAILRNTYAAAASNRHNIILAALRGAAELSRLRTALEKIGRDIRSRIDSGIEAAEDEREGGGYSAYGQAIREETQWLEALLLTHREALRPALEGEKT